MFVINLNLSSTNISRYFKACSRAELQELGHVVNLALVITKTLQLKLLTLN